MIIETDRGELCLEWGRWRLFVAGRCAFWTVGGKFCRDVVVGEA